MLRVVIADDEPLARTRLRRLLSTESDVEIVAECGDGIEALQAIEQLAPDVVFLDIEMPERDGFEVLASLESPRPPAIIFVTAYDEHAIRAFEEHALDYVLKPVEAARLRRSVERARAQLAQGEVAQKLATILKDLRGESLERIAVRSKGRVSFIRTSDVTFIEAAGNYARVHTTSESHLLRETMTALEAKLDRRKFVRIHRSTIVNIDAIRELRPWFGGDVLVITTDGKELTLSRTFRERVAPLLGL
ncbi:MAG TPA: LytTR family DNA-binding domain-containing protein [Thermoanaerobaculia bacterium]|nr:LytTR family DNA-binding domain-containing protein [Thermoanaerobaculia bacterium]